MRVLLKAIVTMLHGSNANHLFNFFENVTKFNLVANVTILCLLVIL